MLFMRKPLALPTAAEALPGRSEPIPTARQHFVNGNPLKPPYPEGMEQAKPLMPDVTMATSAYAAVEGADAVALVTEWDAFRALDLQRVAAGGDHRVDRGVEIGVFLLETRKLQTNLRLILFRHGHRLKYTRRKASRIGMVLLQPWPA